MAWRRLPGDEIIHATISLYPDDWELGMHKMRPASGMQGTKGRLGHILRGGRITRFAAVGAAITAVTLLAAMALPAQAATGLPARAGAASAEAGSFIGDPFLDYDGLCMDVNSDGQAIQATCDGSASQSWDVYSVADVDDTYYYAYFNADGECLGISGDSENQGADVVAESCNTSNPSQWWTSQIPFAGCLVGETEYYPLVNENAGVFYITSANDSTSSGAALVMEYGLGNCTVQDWWLE
jgi:hypothetical protein